MQKGIIATNIFWEYDLGRDHPVRPYRIKFALDVIKSMNLIKEDEIITPRDVDETVFYLFHTEDYIKALKNKKIDPSFGLGNNENPVFDKIFDVSVATVSGTVTAVEMAVDTGGTYFNIGGGMHHAKPSRASGFCYVNDIAIAINYLKHKFPGIKIAYIDIDAHHCDAVQDAFYEDSSVLVISVHQKDIFPHTGYVEEIGKGAGRGYNINLPLPKYAEDEDVLFLFNEIIVPKTMEFSPDILIIQAGADGHKDDPLTSLYLTTGIFERIANILSDNFSCPKVVLGGGGYDIVNVVRVWTLFWAALTGQAVDEKLPEWFMKISIIEGYDSPFIRDIPSWSGNPFSVKDDIKNTVDYFRKNLSMFKGGAV